MACAFISTTITACVIHEYHFVTFEYDYARKADEPTLIPNTLAATRKTSIEYRWHFFSRTGLSALSGADRHSQ